MIDNRTELVVAITAFATVYFQDMLTTVSTPFGVYVAAVGVAGVFGYFVILVLGKKWINLPNEVEMFVVKFFGAIVALLVTEFMLYQAAVNGPSSIYVLAGPKDVFDNWSWDWLQFFNQTLYVFPLAGGIAVGYLTRHIIDKLHI